MENNWKLLRITNYIRKQLPGQIGYSMIPVDFRYPKQFTIVFDEKGCWEIVGLGKKGTSEYLWLGKLFELGDCVYEVVGNDPNSIR